MNLANKITVFRFVLTPLYTLLFTAAFLLQPSYPWAVWVLWGIFILSEVSDLADGFVARRFNQVTDLGKLMDPFADVIFRITYLFLFALLSVIPWWAVMIILWREFTILFIRMMLIKDGDALAAGWLGKIKALFYFFTGVLGQIYLSLNADFGGKELFGYFLYGAAVIAALLALLSLIHYLILFTRLRAQKSN